MKRLSGPEIRKAYKQFFAERGHLVFPSASLVPRNDPTLLWINAGMAPLKPYFDGREIPEKPRIVSSQKCIRTNDIENVGHTARHQTFFEMLGNFSFGDYFKHDAILWAWDFLTKVLEMDPARLSATVHIKDDEAYQIWHDEVGLPDERIIRGDEDNFWEIGEGPCGPCSEIFYDRGVQFGCGKPDCQAGCDCDRFLEIWNLVFTQYNKEPDGSYSPLPKKNIDTGSGLERVASVLQDVPNNFETDLFRPIIDETSRLAHVPYGVKPEDDVHFKIIADHVRTVAFAVGDGVLPGNEGRGYIIRRLLRRAVRSGRKLGMEKPFLHALAPIVARIAGDDYPEVSEKLGFIERVIEMEEERFHETLVEGEALLMERIEGLLQAGNSKLNGVDAFRLYDTFGFPIDLTEEIAAEHGVTVDREGFTAELQVQRERARSARHVTEGMSSDRGVLETITTPSQFVGYDVLQTNSVITTVIYGGELADRIEAGQEGQILLDITPFYAESGGQISDEGELSTDSGLAQVIGVQKAPHGQHLLQVKVVKGTFAVSEPVRASVNAAFRRDITKNHTATHLLQRALREKLGTHVAQAGSLVEPDRLRFDFSHFGPISEDELRQVEDHVNEAILADDPVVIREMDLDAAKALGAMALFGEKYGKRVRVVEAGPSIELCGGCHVERTGLIGLFQIVSETGIGAGTRRIEAVTGRTAYEYVKKQASLLRETSDVVKSSPDEVVSRVTKLMGEMHELERDLSSAKASLNHAKVDGLIATLKQIGNVPVLAATVADTEMADLRQLVDELRNKLTSYVIVLGSSVHNQAHLVAAVSPDLQPLGLHAGKIIKQVAAHAGGSGGGRPDLAQAGAKNPTQLPKAIQSVAEIVSSFAGNAVR